MKKKNTFLGVALLIAVLAVGIAFAATTQTLKISGTASGVESPENFNVVFATATPGDSFGDGADGVTVEIDTVNDSTSRSAKMTFTGLKTVGDQKMATFTVRNDSAEGVAAKFNSANFVIETADGQEFTSDYFTITTDLVEGEQTLNPGETLEFTVYVELSKAIVGEDTHTEQFFISLKDFTSAAVE